MGTDPDDAVAVKYRNHERTRRLDRGQQVRLFEPGHDNGGVEPERAPKARVSQSVQIVADVDRVRVADGGRGQARGDDLVPQFPKPAHVPLVPDR
jgi:hypothetical protein